MNRALLSLLFTLTSSAMAAEGFEGYECIYKNLRGEDQTVKILPNTGNNSGTVVLSDKTETARRSGDDSIIRIVFGDDITHSYSVNKTTNELTYELTIRAINKTNTFNGTCKKYIETTVTQKSLLCDKVSSTAETLMKARQRGVSMSSLMNSAGDNKTIKAMVIDAFEKPRFNSDPYVKRAIEEFRDRWYLECVKTK